VAGTRLEPMIYHAKWDDIWPTMFGTAALVETICISNQYGLRLIPREQTAHPA
jgi:hypothetical protein